MRRHEWDDLCVSASIIESIDASTKIQYMKTKGVFPVAPRDTVVLAYIQKLSQQKYLNVTRSITHPSCPEYSGVVRMDAKIAGQVVYRAPSGDPRCCRVVQIVDGDLKGNIPARIISFVATQAVPKGFKSLDRALAVVEQCGESKAIKEVEKSGVGKVVGDDGYVVLDVQVGGESGGGGEAIAGDSGTRTVGGLVDGVDRETEKKEFVKELVARDDGMNKVMKRIPMLGFLWKFLVWSQPFMVTIMFIFTLSLKAECGVLRRKVVEPSGEVKIVLDGEEHPKVEKNGIEKYDQFADDIEGSYRKRTISARERDLAMKEETASLKVMRGGFFTALFHSKISLK
ncbi:START domain-containing protein 10 [Nowakowskiella sp. JEL0407]|nr:START domain-containing protein 10 [Nowakowskiella sp. JEL0407]